MTTTTKVPTELYVEVQQFYARQMQALDRGDFTTYSQTFTEDGEFRHTPGREPARGREAIVGDLVEFHRRYEDDPVQRRHWFNHIDVVSRPDGSLQSTVYALVVTVRPGARPDIAPSCVVYDVLVRRDGELLNRSRVVDHDQLF
jgi:actinorhodin biosynthesis protein ActVIA